MITYRIHFHDEGFVVVRDKGYRQDTCGCFATEAEAVDRIKFEQSLDDDKARDRAGY